MLILGGDASIFQKNSEHYSDEIVTSSCATIREKTRSEFDQNKSTRSENKMPGVQNSSLENESTAETKDEIVCLNQRICGTRSKNIALGVQNTSFEVKGTEETMKDIVDLNKRISDTRNENIVLEVQNSSLVKNTKETTYEMIGKSQRISDSDRDIIQKRKLLDEGEYCQTKRLKENERNCLTGNYKFIDERQNVGTENDQTNQKNSAVTEQSETDSKYNEKLGNVSSMHNNEVVGARQHNLCMKKEITGNQYMESEPKPKNSSVTVWSETDSKCNEKVRNVSTPKYELVSERQHNLCIEKETDQNSHACTMSVDKTNSEHDKDIYRTGAKCVTGGVQDNLGEGEDYHVLGAFRIKPGRGDRTLSMSCSDKIARWNVIGCQGALISHFVTRPVYFVSIITGRYVYHNFVYLKLLLNVGSFPWEK